MNVGSLFCNADFLEKENLSRLYFALPVVAWDVILEQAAIPSNYFSELIVKILGVGDKTTSELHNLTNLDEGLIQYILTYELKNIVSKTINGWHLRESVESQVVEIKKIRITILQSKITGRLIPHPVHRNALMSLNYDVNENGYPLIKGGSKGKPFEIRPFKINPITNELPDISEQDIFEMWDEYESNDSDIALSDYNGIKSEYINPPEKILSITKRIGESNSCDYLLVKVNKIADDEHFECIDLLEPTTNIPMQFLETELTRSMDIDERVAIRLGLKEIEISLDFKEAIKAEYPRFSERVIDEICRFLSLKKEVLEADNDDEKDDVILIRMQTMYEGLLRDRDVDCESELIKKLTENEKYNQKKERSFELGVGLNRKNLKLDLEIINQFINKKVWQEMKRKEASLKSLILRHLMTHLKPHQIDSLFISQLVKKGLFTESIKFIMDMTQIRNAYGHFSDKRKRIQDYYTDKNLSDKESLQEFFKTIENQLKILNEVY